MNARCLLGGGAILLFFIQTGTDGADSYRYHFVETFGRSLKAHALTGAPAHIQLPFEAYSEQFSRDGRSLYAMDIRDLEGREQSLPGLLRIDFDPIRIEVLPGSDSLRIKRYLVSKDGSKIIIVGSRIGDSKSVCGVFALGLPAGDIRQVLQYCPTGILLSLSPDGNRILATIGHPLDRNTGMELIDLVQGKSIQIQGDWWQGAWSPDGRWIAALTREEHARVVLLDPNDFSRQRDLGRGGEFPSWSPDSRYILLWKKPWYNGLLCNLRLDLDPPWTFETVDIQTGKRKTVPSSRCLVDGGAAGWADSLFVRQTQSPTAN